MFTPKMLKDAHQTIKCVIQVVFEYEYDFKHTVLADNGWNAGCYTIERCHAAQAWRFTLKHDDGREKDLYINSNDVYSWFLDKQDEVFK